MVVQDWSLYYLIKASNTLCRNNELWGQAPFPLYTTYLHTFELGYALSTPNRCLFLLQKSFKIRLRSRFPDSPIVPRFVLAFPDLRRRAHSHPCYSPGDFQIYSWKPIVPRFVFAKTNKIFEKKWNLHISKTKTDIKKLSISVLGNVVKIISTKFVLNPLSGSRLTLFKG